MTANNEIRVDRDKAKEQLGNLYDCIATASNAIGFSLLIGPFYGGLDKEKMSALIDLPSFEKSILKDAYEAMSTALDTLNDLQDALAQNTI